MGIRSNSNNVYSIPVNIGTLKPFSNGEPKPDHYREQTNYANTTVVHTLNSDRQAGRHANTHSQYNNPEHRKDVAKVAHITEVEPSRRELVATLKEQNSLRDDVRQIKK
jgi:hypothetical protein